MKAASPLSISRWAAVGLAALALVGAPVLAADPTPADHAAVTAAASGGGASGASAASGGETSGGADKSEPVVLDVAALLEAQQVTQATIADPIWTLKPRPGRHFIQIPFTIAPGDKSATLNLPPVRVRAGAFIAWRLPSKNEMQRGGSRQPAAPAAGAGGAYQADEEAPLPADAPHLTRQITVQSDGSLHFRLARYLPDGTLKANSQALYAYKLDDAALRKQRPEHPKLERYTGDDPKQRIEFFKRVRADRRQYDEKMRDFETLRRKVARLPMRFAAPRPQRLWAIFAVSDRARELVLSGPAPLPWQIAQADFQALREIAHGRLRADDADKIAVLMRLAGDEQPLTQRFVAQAAAKAGLGENVELNSAAYGLLKKLLASKDAPTRRTTVRALASARTPSDAAMTLLQAAAASMDAQGQLLFFQSLLRGDLGDARHLARVIQDANLMLADAHGPPAGAVLGALASSLDKVNRPGTPANVAAVTLAVLPPSRRAAAITWVAQAAATSPTAADWLDRQLLGATSPAVIKQTLEQLAPSSKQKDDRATGKAASSVGSTFGAILNKIPFFGRHGASPPPPPQAAPTAAPNGKAAAPAYIAIPSTRSNVFAALGSKDAELAGLAWAALPRFTFGDERSRPRSNDDAAAGRLDRYGLLLSGALGRHPTPPQLVPFLARQRDAAKVAEALVQVVIYGDRAASRQAGAALLGGKASLERPLQALSNGDRLHFAAQLYSGRTHAVPATIGLLASNAKERGNPAVRWFAQQLDQGELPPASHWVKAYSETTLLKIAGDKANTDAAQGAAAALVAAAGGDSKDISALVQKLAGLSGSAATNAWHDLKRQIYTRRLAQAAGRYTLSVIVAPRIRPSDPASSLPVQPIIAGTVRLIADGQSVHLANHTLTLSVPDEYLALRIAHVDELKNFPNKTLADLPLAKVTQPLDLRPTPGPGSPGSGTPGSAAGTAWQGSVPLGSRQELTVRLEPVKK